MLKLGHSHVILLSLRWRLMCRGDLQPSCFGELVLQASSLWELIYLRLHNVVTDTILGFYPSHYMIIRGRGMRRRVERSMNLVNGKSIINKTRVNGKEATNINTMKKEGYSLFQIPIVKE